MDPLPTLMVNILVGAAIGFLTAELSILVTTVYLHRGLTHRALTMHPIAAFPLRVILWITSGIRPREWVGVHRRHHAALDTVDDPHSPAVLGATRVLLTNILMYRKAAKNPVLVDRYTHDMPVNRLDRIVFDRETLGPLLGLALLWLVFGWQIAVFAVVFHIAFYVGLNGAVNSIGHTFGTRPAPNSGTNGQVLALLTAGEGLHNNHHAVPTAARLSFIPGQFDPAWWFIRGLERVHLVALRHPGGVLAAR
jgi:stearoyl-CoA desaturase (delta-9 desaturase)